MKISVEIPHHSLRLLCAAWLCLAATVRADRTVAPPPIEGAIEGEAMTILERSALLEPQGVPGASDEKHLWWHGGPRVGEHFTVGFKVEKGGRYRVAAGILKARDYGIVTIAINDQPPGEPVDCFDAFDVSMHRQELGVFDLAAGENRLTVKMIGANAQALKEDMFGLDYLLLSPVSDVGAKAALPASQPFATHLGVSPPGGPRVDARQFVRIYDPSIDESVPWYINDHTFIRAKDGTWHLFGITHAEPANPLEEKQFAHATAPSLAGPWTKQKIALDADPRCGEPVLWAPHVIEHEGVYYLFYCAGDADHTKYKLHVATSIDLTSWKRSDTNPLVVDGFDARDPMVTRIGDQWVMYYTATSEPSGGNHVIFAVTSDDLMHWGNKRVVFTAPQRGTFAGPTESPFIVKRGEAFYLFCGPWAGYSETHVFRSKDPFAFMPSQQVGEIASHALEIVQDTDGTWYASHAGWGQGGVSLAPLTWEEAKH